MSIFYFKNAVLGAGLGLTLALTLTLKQHSQKKKDRPRPRVLLTAISRGRCAVFEREICLKVEKNEIRAERADQKHLTNLPLARQLAIFKCLLAKHVGRFFVSCPRFDATDGI